MITQGLVRSVMTLFFSLLVTGCASLQDGKTADSSLGELYDGTLAADMLGVADATTVTEALEQGDSHSLRSDGDRALLYYIRALELDGQSSIAAGKIAGIHQQRGNRMLAEQAWRTVLAIYPGDVVALEAMGLIRLEQRNYDQTTDYFQKSLAEYQLSMEASEVADGAEPGETRYVPWLAANGLGVISDLSRNYTSSVEHYRQALKMASGQPLVLNNLGYSYVMAGNLQQAEAYLRQALSINGDYVQARRNLALVLTRKNRPEQAVSVLETVMSRAEALNDVGYLMMLNNHPGLAEQLFREAIDSSPTYYEEAWDNLSLVQKSIN